MATITLKGNDIHTLGDLPAVGSATPDFTLTTMDLSTRSLSDFAGKKLVLNIFPNIETGICAASVRQFNIEAAELENTTVLCISRDLPSVQSDFCAAEGIANVVMLSDKQEGTFGKAYGVEVTDSVLAGRLARSVVVVGEDGNVRYTEQVPEIAQEPNYKAALEALMDA